MKMPDLASYMQTVIEQLEADKKRSAAHTYTYALKSIAEFYGGAGMPMPVDEVFTPGRLKEYEEWMRREGMRKRKREPKGLSLNTISTYMRNLKSPFHVQKRRLDKLWRFLQFIEPPFEVCATVFLDMLGHAIALCDQCTAEFGHQFLAGILFRAERCRLEAVENTLGAGGVDHFMKQRSVKGFSGLELFFFGHDYLVSRNRVVCFVLMSRFDRTNPKVIPNHRIDGRETEMFAVFDPFPVLYLQLLPQLRSCLPQVGL